MSSRACHYPVLQVVDAQNSRDAARQTQLDNLAPPKHSRTGTKILQYKHTHTQKYNLQIILLSSEYSECIENEMFSLRKKIFLKQKMLKHRNSVTQNTFSILSKLNNPNKLLSECAFYFQEQKFIWSYMTQNIVLQTIKYSVVVLVVSKS